MIVLPELYETYEAMLRRYAMQLTGDKDQADDLVQETFIRAMSHLALLDILKPHQRRAWLYRTLKNLFLDELNARQRQQNLARQLTWQMPAGDDLEDDSANPFELAPAQYRDLLEKRYVLGLNSQEIAAESGVPAATIRSRLHLALEKLRLQKAKLR